MTRDCQSLNHQIYHLLQKRFRQGLTPDERRHLDRCRTALEAAREERHRLLLKAGRVALVLLIAAATIAMAWPWF